MHDPMTVAFDIKYPWWKTSEWGGQKRKERDTFITIWHVDPEKDGTDDSCGWFCRSRHGDKKVLETIKRELQSSLFGQYSGFLTQSGKLQFSPLSTTLHVFRVAAYQHYKNWRKVDRFIDNQLPKLINFAENPVDSIYDSITNKYNESQEEQVNHIAYITYGWILRYDRPWYRHPRWHIHHWKIQIHPLQKLKRFLFERCELCKKRYPWGYCPVSFFDGTVHDECLQKQHKQFRYLNICQPTQSSQEIKEHKGLKQVKP